MKSAPSRNPIVAARGVAGAASAVVADLHCQVSVNSLLCNGPTTRQRRPAGTWNWQVEGVQDFGPGV